MGECHAGPGVVGHRVRHVRHPDSLRFEEQRGWLSTVVGRAAWSLVWETSETRPHDTFATLRLLLCGMRDGHTRPLTVYNLRNAGAPSPTRHGAGPQI